VNSTVYTAHIMYMAILKRLIGQIRK